MFAISRPVLRLQPWQTGLIYLLLWDTFTPQPSMRFGPYQVRIPQLASRSPGLNNLIPVQIKQMDI